MRFSDAGSACIPREKILRSCNGVDWLMSVWREQDEKERKETEEIERLESVRAAASESMDVFDTFCEMGGLDADAEGRRTQSAETGSFLTRGSKFSQSTEALLGGSSGGRSGSKTLEDVNFTFRLHGKHAAPAAEAPARLLAPKRGLPMGALWESSSEEEDDSDAGEGDDADADQRNDTDNDDDMLPSDDDGGDGEREDGEGLRPLDKASAVAMGPRVYTFGGRATAGDGGGAMQPACPELVAALRAHMEASNAAAAAAASSSERASVDADGRLPPACEMVGTSTDKGIYVENAPWILKCSCTKEKCTLCDMDVAVCNAADHKEVCLGREVACPVCRRKVVHSHLTSHLASECKKYTIACFDCTIPTSRMKLAKHREEWHCTIVPTNTTITTNDDGGEDEGGSGGGGGGGAAAAAAAAPKVPPPSRKKVVLGSTYKDHLYLMQCPARAYGCRFKTEDREVWDKHWAQHCSHRQLVCLSCKARVEWGQYDAHYKDYCTGPRQRPTLIGGFSVGGDGKDGEGSGGTFDPQAILEDMRQRRKPFHDPLLMEHGTFVIPKN